MSYELDALTDATPRDDLPDFGSGDTVRVHAKVVEGNKERIQVFAGVVIRDRRCLERAADEGGPPPYSAPLYAGSKP